jgi:transcriptional regulator with XRE-family HTH domain
MEKYKFGEFIYNKRKNLGLTQDDLGRKLGVTNKAVSKWETGETMPDINLLPNLAATLGVTIDELLTQKKPEVVVEYKKTNVVKFIHGKDFIMGFIIENFQNITWQMVVMWCIGGLLIYLAIAKDMEPTLLLPMGFGAILVNLPMSAAIGDHGPITMLFNFGIDNGELFPLLLFIGIGAFEFQPIIASKLFDRIHRKNRRSN